MIPPQFTKSWGSNMRKEFMSAARKIGRYLGVAALSFSLIACGGEADAASNNSTSTPTAQTTQEKSLPFPDYPAKFGGCIDNNARALFAVSKNEGDLVNFGMHPIIQTPENGIHAMITVYSPTKDYGYILTDKGEGKWCTSQKLTNYTFKGIGDHKALTQNRQYADDECDFTSKFSSTCGTFNRLSGALISKGFMIDYQAINERGHIDTMLSGNGKSYRLTTHSETGATVITGNATQEFVFHTVPEIQSKQMLVKN